MATGDDPTKPVPSPGRGPSSSSGRGPSYPILDLQDAVSRIKKFYEEEGKAAAPPASAVRHWGYSEKSSGGRQTISTLLQYGLLRDEGAGDARRLSVSKLALDILLHPQGSPEWLAALGNAARSPRLFAEILNKYSATGLPSDSTLKHYLIADRDLSAGGAEAVVKNLRASIKFANLDGVPPSARSSSKDSDVSVNTPQLKAEVGDIIQWESNGVLRFDTPKRVRAVQEHDGAMWVFVEGSATGIPLNEAIVEKREVRLVADAPQLPLPPAEIPMLAAEREWLRGSLSKETSYRLLVQGELGSKEIGKLIRLLEAQKMVLDDDV